MADKFTNLPLELIRLILLNLSPKDIIATCRTHKYGSRLCDDQFWHLVGELHFPDIEAIPGLTYYEKISHILTPKIININANGQLHLLTITGDTTIDKLSTILNDKFSINFPSWLGSDLVFIVDNGKVPVTSLYLKMFPRNTMLAAIPLSIFTSQTLEGNLITALTGIIGYRSLKR